MSWQKCPVCNGMKNLGFQKCSTCNGTGIISVLTGLPPNNVITSTNSNADFREVNMESQQEYFGK